MPYPYSGLPLASRIMMEHLQKVARETGRVGEPFDFSMAGCAQELGLHQRTVSRNLGQLQEAKLITFVAGRGKRPTRVTLLPEPDENAGGDSDG